MNERVEKVGYTLPEGMAWGQFSTEVEQLAIDSLPELDKSTVRVEEVEKAGGSYRVVISGKERSRNGAKEESQ